MRTTTNVCVGIRAPRTARNPSEKAEPYGSEAAEFATRRYMQRDVEIEVDAVDKSGDFMGTLFVNKTENYSCQGGSCVCHFRPRAFHNLATYMTLRQVCHLVSLPAIFHIFISE